MEGLNADNKYTLKQHILDKVEGSPGLTLAHCVRSTGTALLWIF